ncbi:hypothetical protein, partial [Pseudodesulfovibrio sp. JC047]|uniref:hypothetical protein n=1 Tax=Pseudodesulfovibrio sp. JC047 TaxID=2683199 RepID=UPI00193FC6CB
REVRAWNVRDKKARETFFYWKALPRFFVADGADVASLGGRMRGVRWRRVVYCVICSENRDFCANTIEKIVGKGELGAREKGFSYAAPCQELPFFVVFSLIRPGFTLALWRISNV